MKKHIPNLITLLNVLSGCIAVVFAVRNKMDIAAIFVFLGIFFDYMDGLLARLMNVQQGNQVGDVLFHSGSFRKSKIK